MVLDVQKDVMRGVDVIEEEVRKVSVRGLCT